MADTATATATPAPAATPPAWDPLKEYRSLYEDPRSDIEIANKLRDPSNFKKAFPHYDYSDPDIDKRITDRMTQHVVQLQGAKSDQAAKDTAMKPWMGFTPGNVLKQGWEGIKDIGRGTVDVAKDISSKRPLLFGNAETGPGESTFHKYVIAPSEAENVKAQEAEDPNHPYLSRIRSVGHSIAAGFPVVGPWAASIGEQAGTGDVGGALARAEGQGMAGRTLGKVAGKVADTAVNAIPGVARTVGEAVGEGSVKPIVANTLRAPSGELRPAVAATIDALRHPEQIPGRIIGAAVEKSTPQRPGGLSTAERQAYEQKAEDYVAQNKLDEAKSRMAERMAKETEAAKPVYPGASLPSVEDFYAHEGAERNALLKRGENAPVYPGARFPAVEDFYANEGAERARMMKTQDAANAKTARETERARVEPSAEGQAGPEEPSENARVYKLPVPNEPAPSVNPEFMKSVPRKELVNLARQGREGAGTQLQNIGKNVLYTPEEFPKVDMGRLQEQAGALPKVESTVPHTDVKPGDTFIDETGDARVVKQIDGTKIQTQDGTPKTYEGEIKLGRGDLNSPESSGKIGARTEGVEGGAGGFSRPENVNVSNSAWEKMAPARQMYEIRKMYREQGIPQERLPTMEDPRLKPENKEAIEVKGVEVPEPAKLKAGESTHDKFYDAKKDEWSPERDKFHGQIADQATAGKKPPEGRPPEAVITVGGTGAGKTTLTRQIMGDNQNLVNIDTDANKLQIPEYEGLKKSDPQKAAARVHDESKAISKRILQSSVGKGLDFVYDTSTGGGGEKLFQALKDRGYNVRLIFADVPVEEAVKRSEERAKTSTDPINKGRIVPEEVVRDKHAQAAQAFLSFQNSPFVDEIRAFDTSTREPKEFFNKKGNQSHVLDQSVLDRIREKANAGQETEVAGKR